MQILAVASAPPFPPNHGLRLRAWHLLTRLARHNGVTLLTWGDATGDAASVAALTEAGIDVVLLPLASARSDIATRIARVAHFIAGGPPPYAAELFEQRRGDKADGPAAMIRALHARRGFDVVVAEEEPMRFLVPPDLGAPLAVHRLNVYSKTITDNRRSLRDRAIQTLDARAWRRFDREVMDGVDLSIAITDDVVTELAALGVGTASVVVPNGVDIRSLTMPPHAARDIGFIGWMNYPPNVDASVWLARDIWPIVQPNAGRGRLRIIGREPSAAVRALVSDTVVVTGAVADMVTACEGIRIGVCPLRSGMGIKNKTLELMSMGAPVVATPRAAEGIGATENDGLFVAETAAELAARINDLLSDDDAVARLGAAARAYVQAHHSWDRIAADYQRALGDLAHQRAGAEG